MLSATALHAALRALPKAELHVHLDGSLRAETMAELARERGVPLPSYDADTLRRHMLVRDAHSLEEYLERFVLTLSVMQDETALRRDAEELVEDHAGENVRYVEIRFCPALCTRDGLSPAEVLDAVLGGVEAGCDATGIEARIIVCALRTLDPTISVEMAELAVAYRQAGVVAFDLAGAEQGNPVVEHEAAFRVAYEAELPITVHAGEGYGPDSVHQAIHVARAQRIGHGTRLHEDPELEALVLGRRLPLEVCMTSNVQTQVAPSYAAHPVRRYVELGIPVALCTDNRLMSGVSLAEEFVHAHELLGFTWDQLVGIARTGFEVAFLGAEDRHRLLTAFDQDVRALAV